MILAFIIRSGQRKHRGSGSGRAVAPAPGRSEQHLGPEVHLPGGVVLHPHLQHPLRLHPLDILHVPLAHQSCSWGWEGGENEAKDSELRSEKTQLGRESKLVSVKRALIFKQQLLSDASIQRALGGSVRLPLCTRTALYIHASSVFII